MSKIEFDGKLNLLALTSFVLSLIALSHQFWGFLRGPVVFQHPPPLITLTKYNFGTKDIPLEFVNIEAPITYTNLGEIGYNDIVAHQTVSFTGPGDATISMTAYNFFDSFDPPADNPNGPINYVGLKAAGPRVVPARDSITNGIRYISKNIDCSSSPLSQCNPAHNFVAFDNKFFEFLSKNQTIKFSFEAKQLGNKKQFKSTCYILTNQIDMTKLKSSGWITLDCYEK